MAAWAGRAGSRQGAGSRQDMRLFPWCLPSCGSQASPGPSLSLVLPSLHQREGPGQKVLPLHQLRVSFYCLYPGGQGMTKVVKGPQPGLMGAGMECSAPPQPTLQSDQQNWLVSVGKGECYGASQAGPCSCADFRLLGGLHDSQGTNQVSALGVRKVRRGSPVWHGK